MSEPEAFFRDLRALRAGAGLSITQLAERAHFPEETLAAAESGPGMPGNPVLVAYVRGCGGHVGEWEDRWREVSATGLPPCPRARRPVRRIAAAAATAAIVSGGAATWTFHSRPASPSVPASQAAPRVTPVRDVAGAGCPASADDGFTLVAVKPGPPWMPAPGGANGDGCDGTSVWTVGAADAGPIPPTFTWFFRGPVSPCTLSVFVPAQDALGFARYAVSTGSRQLRVVTVDQAAEAGRWVVLGSFADPDHEIGLTPAAPRGQPARDPAIAASAAAMTCG